MSVSTQHENELKPKSGEGRPNISLGDTRIEELPITLIVLWPEKRRKFIQNSIAQSFLPRKLLSSSFLCYILETSNKSQSNLPYRMIPLPFEYIVMRASHCRDNFNVFFFHFEFMLSENEKCWLQQCNWKDEFCVAVVRWTTLSTENHPLSHYSINNESEAIEFNFHVATLRAMLVRWKATKLLVCYGWWF